MCKTNQDDKNVERKGPHHDFLIGVEIMTREEFSYLCHFQFQNCVVVVVIPLMFFSFDGCWFCGDVS
jgi:hypothetical protein